MEATATYVSSLVEQERIIDDLQLSGYEVNLRTLSYWRSQDELPPLVRKGNRYYYSELTVDRIRALCIQKGKAKSLTTLFTFTVEGREFDITHVEIFRAVDTPKLILHELTGGILIKDIREEDLYAIAGFGEDDNTGTGRCT